jgi:4-amino-4-deoxy-L-arabinose transferase-like glycosyltransferase
VSVSWHSGSAASAAAPVGLPRRTGAGARERLAALRRIRPELAALIALAGVLDLWSLSRNGWANEYYAAAVRSMSTSWHDFLFASLDRSGVMTVDKPPLALWVQALSVRAFGYHPLSILVPQALMGVATVVLLYDLLARRFGRLAGFVGGLALALTPITVAISRHNNPDALLILCSVAALWCALRAMEQGRTRWLVLAGVCVGLGFETKMGVALVVVPGIALAWLWLTPAGRGRLRALRQLLAAGAAMTLVGGAWPALVELTPAADRPWVSGTADNRILSLIFEYNGLGRVDGQAGGPGGGPGGAGSVFGGSTGPLRLLDAALGGQDGWLLGFALVAALGLLASTRLRRDDARSGWLLAVGGAFAVTAVLFSFASGIFHPYYVSLLAPFTAALVGAGVATFLRGGAIGRAFGAAAVLAGVASELAVLGDYTDQLRWLVPALIAAGALAALALAAVRDRRVRRAVLLAAVALLLIAPGTWAVETLGHATSGTFPEGGPGDVSTSGPGGGFGRFRGGGLGRSGAIGSVQLFGEASGASTTKAGAAVPNGEGVNIGGAAGAVPGVGAGAPAGGVAGPGAAAGPGPAPGGFGFGGPGGSPARAGGRGFGAGGPGAFGSSISPEVLAYVGTHGGGTIAVSSQSTAASAIIDDDAEVAGIGGFSGRESDVSISWLAQEVSSGHIRWVLDEEGSAGGGFGGAGASRPGARAALAAAAKACVRVDLASGEESSTRAGSGTLYDCSGRAAALARLGAQESHS